ncbi:hypothetical protein ACWXWB_10025 [Pantoea dispersa]|uniref:hypothetical protein n=1 Tax=Pantoea dispersa TaxID=59814 RepID=UPI002DB5D0C6|nr:hypothetical protein [Pantoea dispersa]MEB5971009.1 hypothetical protein [Pantoea dispersa]
MNRSEQQTLIDEIIGEAALTLLQRSGPVTTQALLDELHIMQQQASDETQAAAVRTAISEVRASMSAGQKRRDDQPDRENVHPLFGHNGQAGGSRKH